MEIKLAVAIPSYNGWYAKFGVALIGALKHFTEAKTQQDLNREYRVFSIESSLLARSRNLTVLEAGKWGATHVLFLDSDMIFPKQAIVGLLNHNQPIVGVNYPRRNPEHIPTAFAGYETGNPDVYDGKLFTREESKGLVEVEHIGFGCTLIDIRLFDAIDMPFFFTEEIYTDENQYLTIGEDVNFCKKIRAENIPIYCDQDLSKHITHLGTKHLTYKDTLEHFNDTEHGNRAEN